MSTAADQRENLEVAQRLLGAGIVLVVLLFLPGLAHPFAVPKEAVILSVRLHRVRRCDRGPATRQAVAVVVECGVLALVRP